MIKVYNHIDKIQFLEEVAILEYEEWADNKEDNKGVKRSSKIITIRFK